MELRQALKEQYHAGLAMLAECVEKCPEGMWLEGEHPRTFWRIAFHAAFFTHLYLGQNEEAFAPWPAPPRRPISWYFELHDRIRARTLESIKQWPAADATREHNGRPRSMRWVLGHVIQHEAYHGGQAVLLNRLWQIATCGEQA
jgi:hypothetical protein